MIRRNVNVVKVDQRVVVADIGNEVVVIVKRDGKSIIHRRHHHRRLLAAAVAAAAVIVLVMTVMTNISPKNQKIIKIHLIQPKNEKLS